MAQDDMSESAPLKRTFRDSRSSRVKTITYKRKDIKLRYLHDFPANSRGFPYEAGVYVKRNFVKNLWKLDQQSMFSKH